MKGNFAGKLVKTIVSALIIAFVLLDIVVLFPRITKKEDGGTVIYRSIGSGFIYEVERRHSYYPQLGKVYYEVGTIITIFGKELHNDVHVDYTHFAVGVDYNDVIENTTESD